MCRRLFTLLATLAVAMCLLAGHVTTTPAATAAPEISVLAAGSGNGTALLFGGTGQPSGREMAGTVGMDRVPPGSRVIAVRTTANFAPVYGSQSYDVSKHDGARRLVRAIKQTPGKKTVVVYSLSTASADIALRQLRREGYNFKDLTVVKVANVRRNGTTQGIETAFPTFRVAGITSGGPEAYTGVRTYDYCWQYDPACDAAVPAYARNNPALVTAWYANAVLCYFQCHPRYGSRQVNRRGAVVEQRGNTTYVTYRQQAPLTRMTGIQVPNSLASKQVQPAPPMPVRVQPRRAATAPAPMPAPVVVPPKLPVYVPPRVVTPPPPPVVTQRQVVQVTRQVTRAVPQAAPVVRSVMQNPAVKNFLKGLPR